MEDTDEPARFRTIWISDVHLGTRECRAEALLEFLRTHESDTLYLVGDLFDGVRLRRSWFWLQRHNDVVQKLLRKARKGTRVLFLPGNHDEFARAYVGHHFGGIEVAEDAVHVTADGRRLWVVHGDRFDPVETTQSWVRPIAYGFARVLSRLGVPAAWRLVRPLLGRPYRSLARYVKERANDAMAALIDFERTATSQARARGFDGVVCGHTHVPRTRTIDGTRYLNDGDWVSSCTALVEHVDGTLELRRAAATAGPRAVPGARGPPPAPARPARPARAAARAYDGCVSTPEPGRSETYCPHCGHLYPSDAHECPRCPFTADHAKGGRCPACSRELVSAPVGDVAVDRCASCGGIWFDRGEISRVLDLHTRGATGVALGELERRFPSYRSPREHQGAHACVRCRTRMHRRLAAPRSGVFMDVCGPHGIWFERDAFARFREFVRAGGLEVARAREESHPAAPAHGASHAPATPFYLEGHPHAHAESLTLLEAVRHATGTTPQPRGWGPQQGVPPV